MNHYFKILFSIILLFTAYSQSFAQIAIKPTKGTFAKVGLWNNGYFGVSAPNYTSKSKTAHFYNSNGELQWTTKIESWSGSSSILMRNNSNYAYFIEETFQGTEADEGWTIQTLKKPKDILLKIFQIDQSGEVKEFEISKSKDLKSLGLVGAIDYEYYSINDNGIFIIISERQDEIRKYYALSVSETGIIRSMPLSESINISNWKNDLISQPQYITNGASSILLTQTRVSDNNELTIDISEISLNEFKETTLGSVQLSLALVLEHEVYSSVEGKAFGKSNHTKCLNYSVINNSMKQNRLGGVLSFEFVEDKLIAFGDLYGQSKYRLGAMGGSQGIYYFELPLSTVEHEIETITPLIFNNVSNERVSKFAFYFNSDSGIDYVLKYMDNKAIYISKNGNHESIIDGAKSFESGLFYLFELESGRIKTMDLNDSGKNGQIFRDEDTFMFISSSNVSKEWKFIR